MSEWLKTQVNVHNNYAKMMGADPEMFVEDEEGQIVPAWSFMPSKDDVAKLTKLIQTDYAAANKITQQDPFYKKFAFHHGGGGYSYWDGYQAEFTCAAFQCHDGGTANIQNGILQIVRRMHLANPKWRLSMQTAPYIATKVREEATEAQNELGCKPSLNAYGLAGDVPPTPKDLEHRFSGGHIHFSGMYTDIQKWPVTNGGIPRAPFNMNRTAQGPVQLLWAGKQLQASAQVDPIAALGPYVKALDRVLGVWSVGAFADLDQPVRRQYYGLPGEFRAPKHGLEYRTLSNAWLLFGPSLAYLTMGIARACLMAHDAGTLKWWVDGGEDDVVNTIRNYDVARSREIIKANKDLFMFLVEKGIAYDQNVGQAAIMFNEQGVQNFYVEPTAVEANWGLTNFKEGNGRGDGLPYTSNLRWSYAAPMVMKGQKIPTLDKRYAETGR